MSAFCTLYKIKTLKPSSTFIYLAQLFQEIQTPSPRLPMLGYAYRTRRIMTLTTVLTIYCNCSVLCTLSATLEGQISWENVSNTRHFHRLLSRVSLVRFRRLQARAVLSASRCALISRYRARWYSSSERTKIARCGALRSRLALERRHSYTRSYHSNIAFAM